MVGVGREYINGLDPVCLLGHGELSPFLSNLGVQTLKIPVDKGERESEGGKEHELNES